MHILAILLGLIGTGLFWAIRLSANRKNIGDAANAVRGTAIHAKNLPRQRRFKKAYNKRGYDLIETPREAAAVLMIMMARSGETRRMEPGERDIMEAQLRANMQMSENDADGLIRQMDSLTHDIVLPESSISPMTALLRDYVSRDDARDLAEMLAQVAAVEGGGATVAQREFLRMFREPFDLN